jgi:hypothetical protein
LALGLEPGELVFLSTAAAFGEDALEELRSGFGVRMLDAPFGGERPSTAALSTEAR